MHSFFMPILINQIRYFRHEFVKLDKEHLLD